MKKLNKQNSEQQLEALREKVNGYEMELTQTINKAIDDENAPIMLMLLCSKTAKLQALLVRACDNEINKKHTANASTVAILSNLRQASGLADVYDELIDVEHLDDLKRIFGIK